MEGKLDRAGLAVDAQLAEFLEREVLTPLGRDVNAFWEGFAALLAEFAPRNAALLHEREALQAQIDSWHIARRNRPIDQDEYQSFLREIGYLVEEPGKFRISTSGVDPEIANIAGPQLVVPVTNARFLLNAANARWGSLYDTFYGTDALDGSLPKGPGYDIERGGRVIARVREWLDAVLPGWDQTIGGTHHPDLIARDDHAVLFRHHGLHIAILTDRSHPAGAEDPLGICDVVLEAALTTICDLEDSVAAVDAEDKLGAYRNWLGLMRGDLADSFVKNGKTVDRKLQPDRHWAGETLPGRSLLFVRNVGHLMTSPAIFLPDGTEIPEGIMDAVITAAIGAHDLAGLGTYRNSRAGSIYIVKPKIHGPQECAFANDLFDAVEDLLGLDRHTIKIGLMDEERRTSVNLSACIHALRHRIVFINTGFLDRTGDEIHTSMQAGPMVRKADMRQSAWLAAYEARNVAIGLQHGFSGKAQIGKGMWAMPDRMQAMLKEKVSHPLTGANTAWVPSPTAATLHALHYHQVDVFERQRAVASEPMPGIDALLTPPVDAKPAHSPEEIAEELDNNCQGLLGYVVRWVDQGVGCSKVPDISDVGLMEDRATLRISSQHIANWLLHDLISEAEVLSSLTRMAAKVDAQNAGDPLYQPLLTNPEGAAFSAAKDLIFKGTGQPSGYTEPLLHAWRSKKLRSNGNGSDM